MKKSHIEYHKDGTIRATGKLKDGKRDGYWKWYRKDGSKMRERSSLTFFGQRKYMMNRWSWDLLKLKKSNVFTLTGKSIV